MRTDRTRRRPVGERERDAASGVRSCLSAEGRSKKDRGGRFLVYALRSLRGVRQPEGTRCLVFCSGVHPMCPSHKGRLTVEIIQWVLIFC